MADFLPPGEQGDIPEADTDGMRSFAELREKGYTPFSLGPIYVYAGVRWDLVHKFYEEAGSKPVRDLKIKKGSPTTKDEVNVETHRLDMRGAHVRFERPIISHCPGWNNVMNVLDTDSFIHFKKWMLEQQFVDRAAGKFYIVRHYLATMLDPLALDTKGEALTEMFDVFSVCGMKGSLPVRYVRASEAKAFVEFRPAPPEEAVIVLGSVALKVVRDS